MTPQERLDYLLESVFVPTNKQIIVADLVDAVGDNGSRLVLGTIQSAAAQDPLLAAAYQALATVGISLSPPERQAMVDQLATVGDWPDTVRDAVKALGGVNRKRWQINGLQSEPTLESLEAEKIKLETMQVYRDLHSKWLVSVLEGDLTISALADAVESMAEELRESP